MSRRHDYHRHEFRPRQSDPGRRWAVSVKQPLAAMLATGRVKLAPKSEPPPHELIGRRLTLHAGAGDVRYADIAGSAERWLQAAFGATPKALRKLLPKGMAIATAELAGAFRIGRVIEGCAHYARDSRQRAHYLGDWLAYEAERVLEVGPLEGAWAWCFREPEIVNQQGAPLNGVGGVFDLEGVWREQQADALRRPAA